MSQYVESEKVELKAKYTDTICKEIVSFLNADGGQVIIGVDDNGNVIGVDKIDDTLKKISDVITMQIEPNPQEEIRTELRPGLCGFSQKTRGDFPSTDLHR